MSKCPNECGRQVTQEGRFCGSCWIWLQFVRQAKRNLGRYYAQCRKARGK